MPYEYIVITACKNEEINLQNLVQSIEEQTVKPVVWFIIDDGSSDKTPDIINNAKKRNDWIQSLRLNQSKRDIGLHLSKVMKISFDFAIEYCIRNEITYDYFGIIDGDMILESTYFEDIIRKFIQNPKLGIASGGVQYKKDNYIIPVNFNADEPSGGNMLINQECFEDIGEIILCFSWDSALKVKARLHGWETICFNEIKTTETRDATSAEGYWKGYVIHGKTSYFMNTNPIHAFFKGLMYCSKKPNYIGLAYLWGYSRDFILRKQKINEIEIKYYYRHIRSQEIIKKWFNIILNKIRRG